MDNEFIPKTRLFRENYLPGGIVKLRNGAYAQVRGTRNSAIDLGGIDLAQLLDVIRGYLSDWEGLNGAETDAGLRDAIDRRTLTVQCPSEIYLSPFPFVLQCTTCKVIDFYQGGRNEDQVVSDAGRRIRRVHGRDRVSCKVPGCGGSMVQVPYLSVHRCGSVSGINLPFQVLRAANVDFNDRGGSFFGSSFSNHDTGERISTALSMPCQSCRVQYPTLGELIQRGTTILNGEAFFAHNVQYISLPAESGKLVSEVCSHFQATGPLAGLSADLAEGIVSGLLGLVPSTVLRQQFSDLLSQGGADPGKVADLEKRLSVKRTALEKYQGLLDDDEFGQSMLESIKKEIAEQEESLAAARGVFRDVRRFIGNPALLKDLASERRVQETVFFRGGFREFSMADRLAKEAAPEVREDMAHQWQTLQGRYCVDQVSHIADLNVVLAALGYTRERRQPNTDLTDVAPVVLRPFEDRVDDSLRGRALAYAMSAETEGLWIRFDPRKILTWCQKEFGWALPDRNLLTDRTAAHAFLLENCPPLRLSPAAALRETALHPPGVAAPFHLIHTISHCLLSSAKRHTGYDEMSLAEYLLPMDLSFLVYVTSTQNYTAGGLYTLFKHYLLPWFDDASNFGFQCVFDPVCSDSGASCSGCVQRVLGCETFNRGLSRAYLFGGQVIEDHRTFTIQTGFW